MFFPAKLIILPARVFLSLCRVVVSLSCLHVPMLVLHSVAPPSVLCFHVCSPKPVMCPSPSLSVSSPLTVSTFPSPGKLLPLSPKPSSYVKLCELVWISVFPVLLWKCHVLCALCLVLLPVWLGIFVSGVFPGVHCQVVWLSPRVPDLKFFPRSLCFDLSLFSSVSSFALFLNVFFWPQ